MNCSGLRGWGGVAIYWYSFPRGHGVLFDGPGIDHVVEETDKITLELRLSCLFHFVVGLNSVGTPFSAPFVEPDPREFSDGLNVVGLCPPANTVCHALMCPQRAFGPDLFGFGFEPQDRGFFDRHRTRSLSGKHRRHARCYDALDLDQPLLKRITLVRFSLGHLLGLFPTARSGGNDPVFTVLVDVKRFAAIAVLAILPQPRALLFTGFTVAHDHLDGDG